MIHILYRISNNSYNKKRIGQATKENCLLNAILRFPPDQVNWELYGDVINEETQKMIDQVLIENPKIKYTKINTGSGAASFNVVLTEALKKNDDDIIYFVEDDYAHIAHSLGILNEIMDMGSDYGTLYLCPDKFIPPSRGGNPLVDEDGGYQTKMYRGRTELYALFDSTTMTFFSKVKTLKEDESIMREYTTGTYPRDFEMFLKLREKGRSLLCPLISYSTHCEKAWLGPVWGRIDENLEEFWNFQLTQTY